MIFRYHNYKEKNLRKIYYYTCALLRNTFELYRFFARNKNEQYRNFCIYSIRLSYRRLIVVSKKSSINFDFSRDIKIVDWIVNLIEERVGLIEWRNGRQMMAKTWWLINLRCVSGVIREASRWRLEKAWIHQLCSIAHRRKRARGIVKRHWSAMRFCIRGMQSVSSLEIVY